mgnify:CR=1 FL=1
MSLKNRVRIGSAIDKKLYEEMELFKQGLKRARFTGQSQDGKVMIVCNGMEEIVSAHLYVDGIDQDLKKHLENSIEEAANDALNKVRESLRQKANEFTGGIGLDF